MTASLWVGAGVLGAAGAVARVALDAVVLRRTGRRLPWGILMVNASGCLALGLRAGAGVDGDPGLLAAGAFVGAYTTYSTWMVDTMRLVEAGRRRAAALNLALTVIAGLAALAAGWWLGSAL